MAKLSTDELEEVLSSPRQTQTDGLFSECRDSLLSDDRPFTDYMRKTVAQKGLRWRDIFILADVPERYGYKLISGERTTRKRDVIIAICAAAAFSREETRRALRLYGMADLYVRLGRDAVLFAALDENPKSAADLDTALVSEQLPPLARAGGE